MLGKCPNFQGGTAGKIREMDQKQGIPLLCMLESVKFWAIILVNPPCYLFLDIQLQFYCMKRKCDLKSENVD